MGVGTTRAAGCWTASSTTMVSRSPASFSKTVMPFWAFEGPRLAVPACPPPHRIHHQDGLGALRPAVSPSVAPPWELRGPRGRPSL